MFNTYDEIQPDLRWVADALEDNGFEYKAYNKGRQFNANDLSGVTQTFYPTTGTIVLNRSNDKKDTVKRSIRDQDLNAFMSLLKAPETIQHYFV